MSAVNLPLEMSEVPTKVLSRVGSCWDAKCSSMRRLDYDCHCEIAGPSNHHSLSPFSFFSAHHNIIRLILQACMLRYISEHADY